MIMLIVMIMEMMGIMFMEMLIPGGCPQWLHQCCSCCLQRWDVSRKSINFTLSRKFISYVFHMYICVHQTHKIHLKFHLERMIKSFIFRAEHWEMDSEGQIKHASSGERMMMMMVIIVWMMMMTILVGDDDYCQVIAWMRTRTTPKWNYTAAVEPSGRFILSRIIHNSMIFKTIQQHHSMTTTSTDKSIQVFVPPRPAA